MLLPERLFKFNERYKLYERSLQLAIPKSKCSLIELLDLILVNMALLYLNLESKLI